MKKLISTILVSATLTTSAFAGNISCGAKYKASAERALKQSYYMGVAKNLAIGYAILDPLTVITTATTLGATALATGTTIAATGVATVAGTAGAVAGLAPGLSTTAITTAAAALSISPTLFVTASAAAGTLGVAITTLAPIVAPLAPAYILLNQKAKVKRKGVEFETYNKSYVSSLEKAVRTVAWGFNDSQKVPVFLKDVLDLYVAQEMEDSGLMRELKGLKDTLAADLISDNYKSASESAIEKMKANIRQGVRSNKYCDGSDVDGIKDIKKHLVRSI